MQRFLKKILGHNVPLGPGPSFCSPTLYCALTRKRYIITFAQINFMTGQPGHAIDFIEAFKKITGEEFVFIDDENRQHYSHDETEALSFLPDVVVKPRTVEEVSAIMKICNQNLIPITPRGAGTGLSGGALPQFAGFC